MFAWLIGSLLDGSGHAACHHLCSPTTSTPLLQPKLPLLAYVYIASKVHRSIYHFLATALTMCQRPAINMPLSAAHRDNAAD